MTDPVQEAQPFRRFAVKVISHVLSVTVGQHKGFPNTVIVLVELFYSLAIDSDSCSMSEL